MGVKPVCFRVWVFVVVLDGVSLRSPVCSGMRYVKQTGLELTELCLPLPPKAKELELGQEGGLLVTRYLQDKDFSTQKSEETFPGDSEQEGRKSSQRRKQHPDPSSHSSKARSTPEILL
jgi:hypothetical protein